MDINATLFGQIITFSLFVWITMKFIWPKLMQIMEERRNKIADGLAAAEQGKKELELAKIRSKELLTEAKAEASHIIEQANRRAGTIVEEGKVNARQEGERLVSMAKADALQEYNLAKQELLLQVSNLAVAGAEKILQREIDKAGNDNLLKELVSGIE